MFCSALTFPRRLADTRDCSFSNRQAKHQMNSLSKHEPFFFCGTTSASQEFLLFYYFALQQTTSRGFFCYFFSTTWTFFFLANQNNTLHNGHSPQIWNLHQAGKLLSCIRARIYATLDIYAATLPLQVPCSLELIFPNFSSILTFYFPHFTSTRNRFPTYTLQLLYCNFSWEVCPLRCTIPRNSLFQLVLRIEITPGMSRVPFP
uniref:(northern house mosquito) hypothetical protein n=1 Tax=Culex pipiens TaxID=7175 RepID=A0A8D8IF52_CULPI